MPTIISEMNLEDMILAYLRDKQGYEEGTTNDYVKDYALDTERVKRFLLSTQKKKVENTGCFANEFSERKFFTELARQLSNRGVTDVLRKGFRFISELFDLYYPLPSELNPTAQELYQKNIFCITKELAYSKENDNRIDLMVSLNGLPLITMELKNHYTGQTVENAVKQYQDDRDPKDPLLAPKRCAVHFAVDDDDIKMCTWLCGKGSWFLPFNKGVNGGAGNPVNPNGVRTAYLWEEILSKESLSDIIENYAQVVKRLDPKTNTEKVSVVWPRYHQLDCVRKLLAETKAKGVGQKFLIQHSAGSGKSNSITWLAYQLVGLLDGTQALLDSVIVVTDRINLDTQIRNNIVAFKRLQNLVAWADSAESLRDHLASGKKIIITIVHKFPFILDAIGTELQHKRFGIIIDEAHSSQNGSLSAKMNIALGGHAGDDEMDMEERLAEIIEGRKMVKNANYYAFTATPKNKTLQMFGTPYPKPDGEIEHRPFHEYTMKQAIEEGFIMDVLAHYTTYNSYYKIIKAIEEDPEFDKKQAAKKLRAFVESQPETIKQKASIIVEHFHTQVIDKGKVGGQARAMVVTSSIMRAIEFYYEIMRLLEERKSPYKAIVAFSGSKEYGGKSVTEADINGFPSKDIEENMEHDPYRILVVADKFQTGYDQPLLHTMYVDKVLTDVKAVQTLSRLNRCHPKKRDTFVLDFCNEAENIQQSFQRFYKTTILSKETDPNKLNDLITEIEEANIYSEEDVRELNEKYWGGAARETLDPIINKAVDKFKALDDNAKIRCKSSMKSFCRTYPFIAAVMPYKSVEWEMLNTYYALLVSKLPKLKTEDFTEGLIEAIDFDQYRLIKNEEQKIELENKNTEIDPIPVGGPKAPQEPEIARLSDILDDFNSINWENIELAKKQVDELPVRLASDATFVNAAKNSNKETAMQQCAASMMSIVAQMLSENTEFCRNYLDNPDFMNFINQRVFDNVYKGMIAKLHHVEDDKEVRNYIFDMLQMDSGVSDMQIESEVMAKFGERYGGMTVNNWRHIIEDYTSMVRNARLREAKEVNINYQMAAEAGIEDGEVCMCCEDVVIPPDTTDDYDMKKVADEPPSLRVRHDKKPITYTISTIFDSVKSRFFPTKEESVFSSIFAPAEVRRNSHMLIQVYLHIFEQTEMVKSLAKEADKDAERRVYTPLLCRLKKGDRVDIIMNVYGEKLLMTDSKHVIWQGNFTMCQFDYFVPEITNMDELSCQICIFVNKIPIGDMKFRTRIVDTPRQLNPEIIAHKYKKVFISYSHKDEAKVKYFYEGLNLRLKLNEEDISEIQIFFDRKYLKAGDIFPEIIKNFINTADCFILCWSKNASESDYVKLERQLALARAYPLGEAQYAAKITIYAYNFVPQADPPADMKNNFHFYTPLA